MTEVQGVAIGDSLQPLSLQGISWSLWKRMKKQNHMNLGLLLDKRSQQMAENRLSRLTNTAPGFPYLAESPGTQQFYQRVIKAGKRAIPRLEPRPAPRNQRQEVARALQRQPGADRAAARVVQPPVRL